MIDISNLDKAKVLVALYNAARPQGLGFLHYTPEDMTYEQAVSILGSGHTYFDYLQGRVMKADLSGDSFDPYLYDRDNGPGAAWDALQQIS
jgi:hypothetical protein